MRKIMAILFLVGALTGIVGAANAGGSDTYVKDNGVTVIANDVLAPPGASPQAVNYAAAHAGK